MSTMSKTFAAIVFGILVGGAAYVMAATPSDNSSIKTATPAAATTSTTGTAGTVDVSGPCDEAEHANDPRCAGAATAPADDDDPADDRGGDNSGPGSSNSGPSERGQDDGGHSGHGGDD
jgi:hypothetical protein